MKYIIDTHIFLWLLFEPKKVPIKILKVLKDSSNRVAITSISFWEISLKYNLGKLELDGVSPDELPKMAEEMGIEIEQIAPQEMASFYKLAKNKKHKDPLDRIIIWHCISHKYLLVSMDGKFDDYEEFGLKILS
jgi:PIN domain nuclease of toxin-antitoxin system